jgi:hypothetical protein
LAFLALISEGRIIPERQSMAGCVYYRLADAVQESPPVEARLCRWMLRARDLSGSNDLPFTQEFLAEMLGVIRTSVFHGRSHASASRDDKINRAERIQIKNVEGLQQSACECYEAVRSQYAALLPRPAETRSK